MDHLIAFKVVRYPLVRFTNDVYFPRCSGRDHRSDCCVMKVREGRIPSMARFGARGGACLCAFQHAFLFRFYADRMAIFGLQ